MPEKAVAHRGNAGKAAIFTAGMLTTLIARLSHAFIEGLAFTFSPKGGAVVVGTELAILAYAVGPGKPLGIAWRTVALCTLARASYVLVITARRHGFKEQESVWDWVPEGDGMESGAWSVLRQLAISFGKMRDDNEEIAELLSHDHLQPQELAARMYYMYCEHCRAPVTEAIEEGTPAPPDALRALRRYRRYAVLVYDAVTESSLSEALAERGYTLLFAEFEPDMGSGCPAFFCAVHEEGREVLLVIRGTASPEDVFMDVLATGESFDDEDILCHSGMCKAVRYLSARFRALLMPMQEAGYQVTIVGHSLGAGVASLLTAYFKRKGMDPRRLQCVAYETPPCMDLSLARDCQDVVLTLVHGDDVVPRMCAESLASFLEDLVEFDWEPVAEKEGVPKGLELMQTLSSFFPWGGGAGGGQGKEDTERALSHAASDVRGAAEHMGNREHPDGVTEAGGRQRSRTGVYKPFIPGRIVLAARDEAGAPRRTLLPDPSSSVLRAFRLTGSTISDHFIDSAELGEVLGEEEGEDEREEGGAGKRRRGRTSSTPPGNGPDPEDSPAAARAQEGRD
ncbi:hypothetical protein ACKKBG_A02840 [Auxenochlorella protothecoides x Auxenochlorella symbiontica]